MTNGIRIEMSENAAGAEQQEAAAPKTGPKPVMLIGALLVAALAGVGGGFVLAPRLLPAAAHAAGEESEESAEEAEGHGAGGEGKIFRIDNLIVNPAGSEGSRFLMTTVAIEVETEAQEAKLRERDVQVRDLVVSRLESRTMGMLTQPFARDSIKRQLAEAMTEVLGPRARVRVYLPQFVIQ
ncbi:MAG TPA: flagellar basal body-associated FliL family protein [Gemmatimonadales bacterium]|nr:flagellar basal body-associated FliL family protein [Gemmatimonadales bacterium]